MTHRKPTMLAVCSPTLALPVPAHAAKVTDCAKVGLCYCVNDEHKAAITGKIDKFRAAHRRAAQGRQGGRLPERAADVGGRRQLQRQQGSRRRRPSRRSRSASAPTTSTCSIPARPTPTCRKGARGTEYMVMWTALLEGADGMGDFDFVYFAGPQDFARYFGFDGNNDMAKLDAFFDKRVAVRSRTSRRRSQGGLTKAAFRTLLRAARLVDREPRRARRVEHLPHDQRQAPRGQQDGTPGQIPVLFDGQGVAPPHREATVSEGYVGKCPL